MTPFQVTLNINLIKPKFVQWCQFLRIHRSRSDISSSSKLHTFKGERKGRRQEQTEQRLLLEVETTPRLRARVTASASLDFLL